MTTDHLTDEQFSDLLAGDNAPEAAMLHLEQCDHCRVELAGLCSAMGSFKEISMEWAQVEAPRRVHVPSQWEIHRRALPAWSFAAAMIVAVAAVGIHREIGNEVAVQPVPTTTRAPSTNELAEDNRLLMSIDQELSYQEQPSISVADLRAGANVSRRVMN